MNEEYIATLEEYKSKMIPAISKDLDRESLKKESYYEFALDEIITRLKTHELAIPQSTSKKYYKFGKEIISEFIDEMNYFYNMADVKEQSDMASMFEISRNAGVDALLKCQHIKDI